MKNILAISIFSILISDLYGQSECTYWEWAKSSGGPSWEDGYGITIDDDGNIYTTGSFTSPAIFGQFTLTGSGGDEIFVAKMDNAGNYIWAQSFGTSNNDGGRSIVVGEDGNVYVTGYYGRVSNTNSGEIFVSKLSPSGNLLWTQQAGGGKTDIGEDIVIAPSGYVYITGGIGGGTTSSTTANFGGTVLSTNGNRDIFVAKIDTDGNWIWAKSAGSGESDYSKGISTDGNGNVYVSGYLTDNAIFGSISVNNIGPKTIFVAKLNTSGNWQWAKGAGGNCSSGVTNVSGGDIVTDYQGNSYITGITGCPITFGGTSVTEGMYISKIDVSGNWLWARSGGPSNSVGYRAALDDDDNVHICGYFAGTGTFGTTQLIGSLGTTFVVELDASGNWIWAVTGSGVGGYGIALDEVGDDYIIGGYSSNQSWGITNLTSSGSLDVYVAKLAHFNPIPIDNPQTICLGSSYSIGTQTYTIAGTYIDVLQSMHGCDSIVNTILNVENPDLNLAISLSGSTLTALENNAAYQWVDCNNNNVYISGATQQDFTPPTSGSYAVILTSNFEACSQQTATSPCYLISVLDVDIHTSQIEVDVFPNPTKGNITVNSGKFILSDIKISDLSGKELIGLTPSATQMDLNISNLPPGMYFLKATFEGRSYSFRIIKM